MVLAFAATLVAAPGPALAADPTVVSSTSPADGAIDVPLNANLTVTFNQPVAVTDTWAQMFCTKSLVHSLVVTGGPQTFQLAPQGDRATNESCAVTIDASKVEGMLLNYTFSFVTASVAPPANTAPSADAGGPYTVDEGGTVLLSASATDTEGGPLSYAWDLDHDGTFETTGQSATFSAAALDGPDVRTVSVRVTDDGGLSDVADATVTIGNVAPSATFTVPSTALAGSSFALALDGASDPSSADTTAGFTYAFDCGQGYSDFDTSSTVSCPAGTAAGTIEVGGKIRDKDGGVTEYRGTVEVLATFDAVCGLVQAYSTKPELAQVLCGRLERAAAALEPGARAGLLQAFRNQVEAQAGKAFTADQAAVLEALVDQLLAE